GVFIGAVGPSERERPRRTHLDDRELDDLPAVIGIAEHDLARRTGAALVARRVGPPARDVVGVADDVEDHLRTCTHEQLALDRSVFHAYLLQQMVAHEPSPIFPIAQLMVAQSLPRAGSAPRAR